MWKKSFVYILLLLLSSCLVSAVIVDENVTFFDGEFNYTSDALLNVSTSINVSGSNWFLNGLEFCDSDFANNFTTLRDCASEVAQSVSETIFKNGIGGVMSAMIFVSLVGLMFAVFYMASVFLFPGLLSSVFVIGSFTSWLVIILLFSALAMALGALI